MSKVYVDIGVSLEGFIAGPNGRPGNPLGDGGTLVVDYNLAPRSYPVRTLGILTAPSR